MSTLFHTERGRGEIPPQAKVPPKENLELYYKFKIKGQFFSLKNS